jgi:RsiW-degrading membrane proteinase PrsW (M82 family)
MSPIPGIVTSLLPVIVFLITLVFLDSFKLVRHQAIFLSLLAGAGVAFVAYFINRPLIPLLGWDLRYYARYAAPFIEEILKAAYVVFLIRTKHVGFPVDAAIVGFAVGTGFAVVENLYFLNECALGAFACILRGFGTAVMHGGATALFGIAALSLSERYVSTGPRVILPALGLAILVHSAFNHLLVTPILTVAGLVIVLPVVLFIAFRQSEQMLKNWLGIGFDTDSDLLEMISSGHISRSHIGTYLMSLKDRFAPEVVADMLCLLRIHAELSIKAKGVLLMREAGFDVPPDPEVEAKFEELKYLEKNIGKTGLIAMAPFLQWRSRDLWQQYTLGKK